MIEGKFLKFEDGLSCVLEIRKKVFVEELGLPMDSFRACNRI
jgi:hypothetical protein